MHLIPDCHVSSLENVLRGSLVYVPGNASWGIRGEKCELFDLTSRRFVPPRGAVLDCGSDYHVSVDPTEGRIIDKWTNPSKDLIGALYLALDDEKRYHSILYALSDFSRAHLFELESGLAKERMEGEGEFIVFRAWQIWLPEMAEQKKYRPIKINKG